MTGRGVDETVQSPQLLQPAKRGPAIALPALDGRSDLLKAIRDGISPLSFAYQSGKNVFIFFSCRLGCAQV